MCSVQCVADEAFAGLFSRRGRPAESPATLAIVSVLQFVEGLTDAQAADAVRSLERLELVGETLRAALEAIAASRRVRLTAVAMRMFCTRVLASPL
jgi:hypothetical protein